MTLPIWPYQTVGDSYRPAIVFLHGFMGAGSDWLFIAKQLADRFYCILPDLPGHGWNTDFSLTYPLDFAVIADGLRQLISRLGLKQVHLAGYSLGGRIALYTAVHFPQLITTLTIESASPGLEDEETRRSRAELDDQRAEQIMAEGIDAFVEQWYQLNLFQSLQAQPERLNAIKAERKKNDPRWAAKIIQDLSPGRQPPLWDRLDGLPMPTLLLAGVLDQTYTTMMAQIGQKISQAVVEIIPDAGHNVHLEQPDTFSQIVKAFLQN
ncbi:MAG: 2-succinyl-6-hydroxy-2,4-cyclohexadiene-1-carboxylate synthase [Anaerolineales bacterium]|nr:2-succinyl-6-hydroxy-2,4-cyclohexadiene-1-carboxylate synthase [Anaerolineales bacterium]